MSHSLLVADLPATTDRQPNTKNSLVDFRRHRAIDHRTI